MFRVILKSAAVMAALAGFCAKANAVEVYMFKGAGDFSFVSENMHFSLGLNKMADTLNAEGIHAEVRRFGAVEEALATIRKRKPKSIAFVGHSMGALASMAIARNLKDEGVNIVYMALLDIPGPVGVAGDNVAKVENYFTINPVYGRLTNVNSHPDAKNIHVPGYIHNRLDDAPRVQKGILQAIRTIHAEEQNSGQDEQPVFVEQRPQAEDLRALASASQAPQGQLRQAASASLDRTSGVDQQNVDAWQNLRAPTIEPRIVAFQPGVDPVVTASTSSGSVAETGRDLMQKVGGYLRSSDGRTKENLSLEERDR